MRDPYNDNSSSTQGLTQTQSKNKRDSQRMGSMTNANIARMRARLKGGSGREISERKQVGDAESMMNEEQTRNMPGALLE